MLLIIYLNEKKTARHVIRLAKNFEGSPKDIAHDLYDKNYHSFTLIQY